MEVERPLAKRYFIVRDVPNAQGQELGLTDFFSECWHRKWTIVAITLLFAGAALSTAKLLPKKYEANVLMAPALDDDTMGRLGSLGSAVSELGGLASLVGLTSSGGSSRAEAVATLQSRALTNQFITQEKLLPVLFYRQWDPDAQTWRKMAPEKMPTLWKADELFNKIRVVSENTRTGLITLTVTWIDPKLASQWANELVQRTNSYLRSKAIDESEKNIAYLNAQLEKTSVVELRSAIYSLMENEIKTEMLAKGRDEYALRVIDPAITSERPVSPRPLLWTAIAALVGFSFAVLTVGKLAEMRAQKARRR